MDSEILLVKKLNLKYPLLGVYDAPDKNLFDEIIEPPKNTRACMFAYFNQWAKNKTLCLSENRSGCKGCAHWWFGKESRSKTDFVNFLVNDEGLKKSHQDMREWIETNNPYKPENEFVFIGPYKPELNPYVKTITFWVNADQLSVLSLAAHYFNKVGSKPPVMTPFGSGCMQTLTLFNNFNEARAIIGSMDLAMRQYLPSNIFAFTVTLPMFELFSKIDEESFLSKPFLQSLLKVRGGKL